MVGRQPFPTHYKRLFQQQAFGLSLCTAEGTFISRQPAPPTIQSFLDNSQGSVSLTWVAAISLCSEPFSEWPQAQHWSLTRICINLVNTTCPTLVTPRSCLTHEALSADEPYRTWQVAAGLRVSWLFAELCQAWYSWQRSSVLSVAIPTCL